MPTGMDLQVRSLDLHDGMGTLTVHFERRADYKAAVARLDPGTVLFDDRGQAHRLRLLESLPIELPVFPSDITLSIVEEPLPPDAPTCLMHFGNNYLQAGATIQVVDFVPPTPGGADGQLEVWCDTREDYSQVRRFVDESHGSALSRMDGSGHQYYVQRKSDDLDDGTPFPKAVVVQLRWHRQ